MDPFLAPFFPNPFPPKRDPAAAWAKNLFGIPVMDPRRLAGLDTSEPPKPSLPLRVIQDLMAVADHTVGLDLEDLTDHEKLALAVVAGCDVGMEMDPKTNALRLTTRNPIGFRQDRPGGPIVVVERMPPKEER